MSFRIYTYSVKNIFLFHLTVFVPQLVYYRKSNFKLTRLVPFTGSCISTSHPSFISQFLSPEVAGEPGCTLSRGEHRKTPGHGPTVPSTESLGHREAPGESLPSLSQDAAVFRKSNTANELRLFFGARILVGRLLKINFFFNSIITPFCKCKPSPVSRLS